MPKITDKKDIRENAYKATKNIRKRNENISNYRIEKDVVEAIRVIRRNNQKAEKDKSWQQIFESIDGVQDLQSDPNQLPEEQEKRIANLVNTSKYINSSLRKV